MQLLWVWALALHVSMIWSFQINVPFGVKSQPPVGSKQPIPGNSPLNRCDIAVAQVLDITQVDLTPNPPTRGSELAITASGVVTSTISEGSYVDVEVRLGYIRLLSQRFDLCEMLSENEVSGLGKCPIQKGNYALSKVVQIPDEVPPGKYTILARAYSEQDELLTCITGDIVFPVDSFKP